MSQSNADIIKKADITIGDLAANGGLLNPEQTNTFIVNMINQPTILNMARVVTMGAPTYKVNKIGFGGRILRKATSVTAVAENDRAKPITSQVELQSKEIIAEVRIPYDVLEDNIEGGNINAAQAQGNAGGLMNTILTMIAERAALDLEEWALRGDTSLAGTDAYLGMNDGWLKLAAAGGHTGGFTLGKMSKDAVKTNILALPTQYLRNRAVMRNFMSYANETELRDTYAARQTALGDNNLQNSQDITVFGTKVTPAALMPENKVLFTNPLNLLFGIQRKVTIEYEKSIRTREFIIVLTLRCDAQIEEDDATVLLTGTAPVGP
ncbi:MAG: phage major capsid protein [Bacteroidaceae bacterium]